ncbi:MAG: cytochrome c biogenesis protein CcsA [Myxococcota bacterium]
MLVSNLFLITAALYATSCSLFLVHLARGTARLARWAVRLLCAATAAHLGFASLELYVSGLNPVADIHSSLALLSLLIVCAFLLALLRYRITVLGAFLTPLTLLFFLGAGLDRSVTEVPANVRSALLPVHIGVNILGVVAFALAAASATAYVLQERMLRQKRLGGLFERLPSLDVLDSLGFRLVLTGFPLLTVGLITGTIWVVQSESINLNATQGFAVMAWLMFAAVLLLRIAVGWRGRRAAIGTILGFLCAMLVLAGYLLRSGGL